MTQPDPHNPLTPFIDLLKIIAEHASKLPVILGFGLFISLLYILLLSIGRDIPNALIWFSLAVIAFFILMSVIDRWFNLQEKKLPNGTNPNPDEPPPPPPNPDEPTPTNWERSYLRYLVHLCGYPPSMALVDIKEAGMGGQKLALERIFTSLDVPAADGRTDPTHTALSFDRLDPAQTERLQREPALAAISHTQNSRLVILGAPGSGKSTLVNYLTLCLAGERLVGDFGENLPVTQEHLRQHKWGLSAQRLRPVRVVLREYAARGLSQRQSIWDFIAADLSAEAVGLGGYTPHLKKQLQTEGGILLLDGLDEVDKAATSRDPLKRHIEQFARDFPKVRVVVTSRPYAYGSGWELTGFQVTRLLSFSNEQIKAFIEQWYTVMGQVDGTLGSEKAKSYGDGLVRQVENNRNLREMARHPLLLTMMVYIHRGREGGALPQRREELYELSVVLLLDLWRRSKTVPGQETKTLADVLGMDTPQLLDALAEVAFTAHRDQPEQSQTADIPGEILAGKLHKYKSKQSQVSVEEIIEYVRDRAGLLEAHGRNADDSDDVYRFPHRTFQEYLAGLHLLKQRFPYDLAQYARSDPTRWRESLLLAATSTRKKLPASVWLLAAALCQSDPTAEIAAANGDETLWGAFLAGQVLLETELTSPDAAQIETEQNTRQRLSIWHKTILTHGLLPPRDRALAGQALAALGDDRPGILTCDHMPLCTVPGGPFWLENWDNQGQGDWYHALNKPYWIGQYPVTAAQFREFVHASGYKPSYGERPLRLPDNWPVVYINWYDALAFAHWLDKRWRAQGWLPEGYRVILPSEVEWEKAARGGQEIPQTPQIIIPASLLSQSKQTLPPQTLPMQPNQGSRRRYPWGDEPEKEALSATQTLYRANNEEAGLGEPCTVGSFPAGVSPYGCHDLSGQVWEWTRSIYGQTYPYRVTPEYETMDAGNQKEMVLRGGSYFNNQNVCSARNGNNPHNYFNDNNGVRVVVSPFLTADL
jgi:formylglycine-generating enzyme required for sulfatase activity/energy-coupling factor transporter ATP-binding protein EcfA2